MSLGTDLSAAFVPMASVPGSILNIDYRLYVSHRHQYCPQLYVRFARQVLYILFDFCKR